MRDISIVMRNPVLESVLLMWHFSNIVAIYISMFSAKVFVPYIFFQAYYLPNIGKFKTTYLPAHMILVLVTSSSA